MNGTKTTIYESATTKVIRVDVDGHFFYTRTYIYDANGRTTKDITVFADGEVTVHTERSDDE